MDCTYKGVGGGGVGGGGGLSLPIGLFGVAMSPRSVCHRPRQDWRALRDVSTNTGVNIRPISPISALHGPIVTVVTLHGWQNQL